MSRFRVFDSIFQIEPKLNSTLIADRSFISGSGLPRIVGVCGPTSKISIIFARKKEITYDM